MLGKRLINTNAGGGGANCLDPFGDSSGLSLYKLNGNANDESGNYNGTAISVTWGAGNFGQAAVFNGSSSQINLGTNTPLNNFSGSQSVSCWVKTSSFTSNNAAHIIGYRVEIPLQWNQIRVESNGSIRLLLGENGDSFISTATMSLNVWNHICVTVNSSNIVLYVNGVSNVIANPGILPFSYSTETTMGYRDWSNSNYFNGSIDQVRIFNKALSAGEVNTLYTSDASCG